MTPGQGIWKRLQVGEGILIQVYIVGGGSNTSKFKMFGGGLIRKKKIVTGQPNTKFKMMGGPPWSEKSAHPYPTW